MQVSAQLNLAACKRHHQVSVLPRCRVHIGLRIYERGTSEHLGMIVQEAYFQQAALDFDFLLFLLLCAASKLVAWQEKQHFSPSTTWACRG